MEWVYSGATTLLASSSRSITLSYLFFFSCVHHPGTVPPRAFLPRLFPLLRTVPRLIRRYIWEVVEFTVMDGHFILLGTKGYPWCHAHKVLLVQDW